MQKISKPDLVDFLRISDHRRWLFPRIRYASIRSKPELLLDLRKHFAEKLGKNVLEFLPRNPKVRARLPQIQYDFRAKTFLFDGTAGKQLLPGQRRFFPTGSDGHSSSSGKVRSQHIGHR